DRPGGGANVQGRGMEQRADAALKVVVGGLGQERGLARIHCRLGKVELGHRRPPSFCPFWRSGAPGASRKADGPQKRRGRRQADKKKPPMTDGKWPWGS